MTVIKIWRGDKISATVDYSLGPTFLLRFGIYYESLHGRLRGMFFVYLAADEDSTRLKRKTAELWLSAVCE